MREIKITNSKKINLLEALVWFVVATSFLSILTLICGIFKPILVVLFSLILIFGISYFQKFEFEFVSDKKLFLPLLVLVLIALFFRIDSEQYIMGGQDEGVYVNMSKYFENHGQVFPKDDFRASLNDELKTIYDHNNLKLEKKVVGENEGNYLPGVYIKDAANSEYVFQFYHLHPLWMALFGDTFGEDKRQFSLIFFALLSVVFFYLIIHKIASNAFYSFGGGLLLAVSPLHAYFTKFPVTEVMALFFSLAGFYFLLLYYKNFTEYGEKINRYLLLSALIFGALFFVRIHGFMFIPFFYALFLLAIVVNTPIKKELLLYFIGIFALFALSVWYGFVYSYPYVTDIYRLSFSQALGINWNQILLTLIALMIIFPFLLSRFALLQKLVIKAKDPILKYFYILFFVVLALGMYKVYQLGFTDKYIGHPLLDSRWHLAGDPLNAFLHSSLVVLIEHVSLILFVVFSIALKTYDRRNNYLNTLVLFILGFWVYALILQWIVPYQYYYARYLLSELIPYLFLFTVIFMATMKHQRMAKSLLIVSVVYFVGLTSLQLKGTESKGAYDSLNQIVKEVSRDDLLLVNNTHLFPEYPMEIKTTLKYYYDLNVFSFSNDDILKIIDLYIERTRGDVYVLTGTDVLKSVFTEIKNIPINIETTNYTEYHSPFIKYFEEDKNLTLYKLDKRIFIKEKRQQAGVVYQINRFVGIIENFNDSTWTKSNSFIRDLEFDTAKHNSDRKILKFSTHGYNPNQAKLDILNLQLKVNGKSLEFIKYADNSYYFKLPKGVDLIQEIEISSNTFNPKKMGMNNDDRDLGIDLKEIKLIKDLPQ